MSRQARQHLKRRPDGRYRCRYKSIDFYGDTEQSCLRQREDYIRRQKENATLAQHITLERYAAKWVTTYKAHLTTGPYNECVRILRAFCDLRNLGTVFMTDVTTIDIQGFYNTYKGKSYSSIMHMRDTIRGLFRAAVADRVITYDPSEKAKLPRGKKGTHRAITQHERALIHTVDHPLRPCVMTMLYAGLRRGQALAINVDEDVDFEKKTITVSKAIRFEDDAMPVLVQPKTEAGVRTVPLFSILQEQLRNVHGILAKPVTRKKKRGQHDDMWRYMSQSAWASAWRSYNAALCDQENGTNRRWYGKKKQHIQLAAEGKLPPWKEIRIRAHDLRHSFATMVRDAGVDLKTAMIWMGHEDQDMLLQVYDHPDDYRIQTAKNSVQELITKK